MIRSDLTWDPPIKLCVARINGPDKFADNSQEKGDNTDSEVILLRKLNHTAPNVYVDDLLQEIKQKPRCS